MVRKLFVMGLVVAVSYVVIAAPTAPVSASTVSDGGGTVSHCVVNVMATTVDSELVLSKPHCYGTFSEAMLDASDGRLRLPVGTPGSIVFSDSKVGVTVASFTLGIHYDGFGGSGSSISVVGSSCAGGWWNTSGFWDNRISSSFNGCYRLKHHDGPNRTGGFESTIGSGSIHDLTFLNNRTESVSYWSS